jgi:hypothetical protein
MVQHHEELGMPLFGRLFEAIDVLALAGDSHYVVVKVSFKSLGILRLLLKRKNEFSRAQN